MTGWFCISWMLIFGLKPQVVSAVHLQQTELWSTLRGFYLAEDFQNPGWALPELKKKVQETHVWKKREGTEKCRPPWDVVEKPWARNATDILEIARKELRRQNPLGLFHLLVAEDGVNAFRGRLKLQREHRILIAPEELALAHNLGKMVENDWRGGAIMLSLSWTESLFKSSTSSSNRRGRKELKSLRNFNGGSWGRGWGALCLLVSTDTVQHIWKAFPSSSLTWGSS